MSPRTGTKTGTKSPSPPYGDKSGDKALSPPRTETKVGMKGHPRGETGTSEGRETNGQKVKTGKIYGGHVKIEGTIRKMDEEGKKREREEEGGGKRKKRSRKHPKKLGTLGKFQGTKQFFARPLAAITMIN